MAHDLAPNTIHVDRRQKAPPSRLGPGLGLDILGKVMESIDELLDRVEKVCPLPSTAQRVLALTGNDASNIPEVAKVIAMDPALAAAVLSVANSAAFGLGKVDRLEVAVMRIGLRELHNLAAAMAVFAAFRNQGEQSLMLHEAGVAAGAIAHQLAKASNTAQLGTAFVCGLLSEIGAMTCLVFDGKDYVHLFKKAGSSLELRAELERVRYGASSFDIGRRFLERNALPEVVCEAVGSELGQDPAELPDLAKITIIARHIPALARYSGSNVTLLLPPLEELCQRIPLPGIDSAGLLAIWQRVSDE
jgi:HD-like signal output (HDOD) protein